MEASCITEKSKQQTFSKTSIEDVVIKKEEMDFEDSESFEYIECTPLLIGIDMESDDVETENDDLMVVNGKLQCPSCEYKTRRRDLLLSHTMLHEKESSLSNTCQPVEQAFTMMQRGEQCFYKCMRCLYLTAAWQEIKRHVRRKHTGEAVYTCDWCTEFASPNLAHLKRHVERQHWCHLPYRCENCKYTAWRLREFQVHKSKRCTTLPAQQDTRLRCTLCKAQITDRKALIKHLREHKATYCNECKKWVNNKSIDRHKKNHNKKIIRSVGRKKKSKR